MSSDDYDALRDEIAAAHGLPPSAARFLAGDTTDALEHAARDLAAVTRTHTPAEPGGDLLADVFTGGRALKDQRRAALTRSLCASPPQPRDPASGRYTHGFDGGARRAPTTQASDPAAEHGQWLAARLADRRTDAGRHL